MENNIPGSDAEWEEYLIKAHAIHPHMTPAAYAGFQNEAGENSYAVLAGTIENPASHVLDLACGDGHLVPHILNRLGLDGRVTGVDMAGDALDFARQEILDPRVTFLNERAQKLSLPSESVDLVLCHMAFMLMTPLPPVARELSRILKPGGSLVAIFGGREAKGLMLEIRKIVSTFVKMHIPRYLELRQSRFDLQNQEGLAEVLPNFQIEVQNFQLRSHISPDDVWGYLKGMYFVDFFKSDIREELRQEILGLAKDHKGADEHIDFFVPFVQIKAKKI